MCENEYKNIAHQYDDKVNEYDSYAHDVLFGMTYQYVNPNELLLDLGIGTGLSSIQFSKVGLKVYGVDKSEEMLNICKSKTFATELKIHNLLDDKLLFKDDLFDHVICCGVLHFIGNLENLFKESARVIKRNGIFAFLITPEEEREGYTEQMTSWGIPIYKHSLKYIKNLLDINGMKILKEQRLLMKGADKVIYNMEFSILVTQSQ